MHKFLITGATGFIGQALLKTLLNSEQDTVALSRYPLHETISYVLGDLKDSSSLLNACEGIDTIIHCAGFAHNFTRPDAELAEMHYAINYLGTQNLLKAAIQKKVRRFVFLSSVKAVGLPSNSLPVDESYDKPPESSYGKSKREAELLLNEAYKFGAIETTNLRLSMVYGSKNKGNLERMRSLTQRGMFPPLPETDNLRSLVYIDDAVTAIIKAAESKQAAGETFIVTHPQAYSGRQIYLAICESLNKKPPNWQVPASALYTAGLIGDGLEKIIRRPLPVNSDVISRLLSSEHYSPEKIHRMLGWQATTTLKDGLAKSIRQELQ